MPSKNTVKIYLENGYYHVYNRGVEKREIFLDEQDCVVFLHYIRMYLSPIEELQNSVQPGMRILRFIPLNLSNEINLISFALMPNHIHLQLKQISKDGVTKFMRRLSTSYAMYFNKKYKRVGPLFQGIFKAANIESDAYLLHLSRYIHLNAMKLKEPKSKINFLEFSSYPYYLGDKKASWIKIGEVLNNFNNVRKPNMKDILSYQSFVEDYSADSSGIIGELALEDDC